MAISKRTIYKRVSFIFLGFGCLAFVLLLIIVSQRNRQPSGIAASDQTPQRTDESEVHTISVDARQVWVDSNVQVNEGDIVTISATGQVNVASPGDAADKWVGPEGWGDIPVMYCGGQPCRYVFRTQDSMGCLIGRIGSNHAFKIGRRLVTTAQSKGRLYLSVNDAVSDPLGRMLENSNLAGMFSDNRGTFDATIAVERYNIVDVKLPRSPDGSYRLPATYEGWYPLGTGAFTIEIKGSIDFGGQLASPDRSPILGNSEALVPEVPFGVPVGKIGEGGKPFMIGYSRRFETFGKMAYIAINDSYYADNKGTYIIYKR